MSLVINTFEDLVYIVESHPEWRRRLKRALFDIDLEASLARLSEQMEKLAATQDRQAEDIKVLKDDVSVLKSDVSVLKGDVATLKGKSYEVDYWLKAAGIFGAFIRSGRNRMDDIATQLYEAVDAGQVTEQELDQVLSADMLWGGKLHKDGTDITVVLEASWRAEAHDIERAAERAQVLRRIGVVAVPMVAGVEWNDDALALAVAESIVTATDRRIDRESWHRALSALT